ncbi:protein MIZU-KUSSEI 1-like [Gastrolobium bilobum]|uniref:protein MIZU-KUSSEI 1-like n=1 Tax=Gastrolobium bilobum TaxID=150636 RepID=UPI002AAF9BEE|nr:protein MIZU-KUSSEI 1-like [Gastrolobium bilobum]
MKTIMAAKSPHDSSFSFSRRYFHWKKKALDGDDEEEILNISSSSHFHEDEEKEEDHHHLRIQMPPELGGFLPVEKKKHSKSKFRSALTVFRKSRSLHSSGLGTRVVGTLFGYRRGHVHFAFQEDPKLSPAFLIELATPTSVLVKEMASGLVRIALECEKKTGTKGVRLLEEPLWRTYCNGRKCGYANRRECGPEEWKILKAVEPISMGAGVLPMPGGGNGAESEGELMYMRAKYERVVGSKDSEAFYMMNPDGSGGPELSIYLLRV